MSDAKSRYPSYTLGLDIGNASVGAALLADGHILALHVRTFDRAEVAKTGESLNSIRREKRSSRRRLRRRAHRLLCLRRFFARQGMLPSAAVEHLACSHSPWQLRIAALDRLLSPQEWACALYHLVKHRGYQSTRKSEAADKELGKMLNAISHNQQLMDEVQARTVAELVMTHPDFAQHKRNKQGDYSHTFSRDLLLEELGQLFAAQRQYSNPHADASVEEAVQQRLMQRRPALAQDDILKMVGRCTFENEAYRAPKACFHSEQFVWLTKLNNLRLHDQGKNRSLSDKEYDLLLQQPFINADLTYAQVRKQLELDEASHFIGLDYRGEKDPEKTTFFKASAFHALRRAYEKAGLKHLWLRDSQDHDKLDTLAYAATVFKEDDAARQWLLEQGIEADIIEAMLSVNLPFSHFINLSLKALKKILPYMEKRQDYSCAVKSAGYAHHSHFVSQKKSRYIPRFSRRDVSNPVVARALNQARKMVNAIVREYDPPSAVHIELARDLSRPYSERKKIEREQKNFRDIKEKDKQAFEAQFGFTPKGLDLLKWRLYREQDAKCAYSLQALDIQRLFEAGYIEVDHALPYSRSFDDSLSNKVLVRTAENRNKGNRTPHEYLSQEQWHAFRVWVNGNPKYHQGKRAKLLCQDFGADAAREFRERHLNDTRYIAREFKRMLETHLALASDSPSGIKVVTGGMTAYLRLRWGLLKVREDGDRHHALDAAVVAACSPALQQRISHDAKRRELCYHSEDCTDPETGEVIDVGKLRQQEARFPQPWPHFREELLAHLSDHPQEAAQSLRHYSEAQCTALQPMRVSRAPKRRNLGAAHEDTIRSARCLAAQKSIVKVPLTKLKLSDLPNIVGADDPRNAALINAIEQRLQAHQGKADKAFAEPLYKPGKAGKIAPVVRTVKLISTQKSGLPVRGGIANNGDMVRIDLFQKAKHFYAVPVYVADLVRGQLPDKAPAGGKETQIDASFRFLFSLYPNDWLSITFKNKPLVEGYYVGFDRHTAAINLRVHDNCQSVGKGGVMRGIGIKTALSLCKYHVDVLGRLHRVYEEVRQTCD